MRLCKDCKQFKKSEILGVGLDFIDIPATCRHPDLVEPVYGGGVSPSEQRKNKCGPEGTYWEAK